MIRTKTNPCPFENQPLMEGDLRTGSATADRAKAGPAKAAVDESTASDPRLGPSGPRGLGAGGLRRSLGLVALLGLGALSGCFSNAGKLQPALDYWAREDVFQAYHEVARVRAENPDDPEVERVYQAIRRDKMLWDVRQAIYRNEELRAIGLTEQLLTLFPDTREAVALREKAERKLSAKALQDAQAHLIQGSLDKALISFQRSLAYDPANLEARQGLEEVDATYRRLRNEAEDHYLRGIRQLAEGRVVQTAYQMRLAMEADSTFDPARRSGVEAQRRLAEQAYQEAIDTQDNGYYDAAAAVYQSLMADYPDLPGITERLARATAEAEARDLVEQAQIHTFKGEFEAARELLEQARERSQDQLDKVAIGFLLVTEREQESLYARARDEEIQGRLEQALTMYREIESASPGLLDVPDRIIELGQRIEEAKKAYAAGRAAEDVGDLDEAIRQYGAVGLFWEGYEDAEVRRLALVALRKEQQAAEQKKTGTEESGGESSERGDG